MAALVWGSRGMDKGLLFGCPLVRLTLGLFGSSVVGQLSLYQLTMLKTSIVYSGMSADDDAGDSIDLRHRRQKPERTVWYGMAEGAGACGAGVCPREPGGLQKKSMSRLLCLPGVRR
jgi:hypothetical protein